MREFGVIRTSGAIALGEITTLDHEIWNDAMEFAASISEVDAKREKNITNYRIFVGFRRYSNGD